MKTLNAIDWLALTLLIVGGINWGMIGAFNIDIVGALFGTTAMFTQVVYAVVGIAALYTVYILSMKTE